MIKENSNTDDKKKLEIEKLILEQQKDQNSNMVYSQKIRTPSLDRWNDVTVGQLKLLLERKEIAFEELVIFIFVDVFNYTINSLSKSLKNVTTSRRTMTEKYEKAVGIIKGAFEGNVKKVYIKNHKKIIKKKTPVVSEEVREVFEEWDEYSKDYSNFVDNRYRQRNEHRRRKNDI